MCGNLDYPTRDRTHAPCIERLATGPSGKSSVIQLSKAWRPGRCGRLRVPSGSWHFVSPPGTVMKSQGTDFRGSQTWIHGSDHRLFMNHALLYLSSGMGHLTSLNVSLLICKMEVVICPAKS